MKNLDELRLAINHTNDQLLALLNERARIAQEIGAVKKQDHLPVYQPERELEVLEEVAQKNSGPLSGDQIKTIMQVIMQECRAVQITTQSHAGKTQKVSLPLQAQGLVAYLGPEGTFTHAAVVQCFGDQVQTVSTKSMTEAIQKLVAGEVAHAVVAIENSTEGVVNEVMDALISMGVSIRGELIMSVHFDLLMKNTADTVKIIYAHPQALAQCRQCLNKNFPEARQVAVSSNAEGARLASIEVDSAALGNELMAKIYHLNIKQKNLQDSAHNQTRFLVLGAEFAEKYSASKTTLLAHLIHNNAGQLDKILRVFAAKRLDMTLLETRPDKVTPWEYVFVFDVRADIEDPEFQEALVELHTIAKIQVLGSYPELAIT